jgi:hypothetical protein
MLKTEFLKQYEFTWNLFKRLVNDFDRDAWKHTGRGATTPVRLSLQILQAAKYYLKDKSEIVFESGKPFDINTENVPVEALPTQDDLTICISDFRKKTEKWLSDMEFVAKNVSFDWAGETQLSVVIFLLRHSLFHLGELSSLLNESKNGEVEDHFVKT